MEKLQWKIIKCEWKFFFSSCCIISHSTCIAHMWANRHFISCHMENFHFKVRDLRAKTIQDWMNYDLSFKDLPLSSDPNQLCWRLNRRKVGCFVAVVVRPVTSLHIQSSLDPWWNKQSHMHRPTEFARVESHHRHPLRHQLSRHRAVHSRVSPSAYIVNRCSIDIRQCSGVSSNERSMLQLETKKLYFSEKFSFTHGDHVKINLRETASEIATFILALQKQ